jgi:pimeloyl-ACP methyl ester carboxylesterase
MRGRNYFQAEKGEIVSVLNLKDGGNLYYEVHGEGEPLIFMNGVMMNTMSWMDFIPQLSDKFKVIVFDFRDQGRSSKLAEGYDVDIHVEDTLALLDELKIDKVNMIGPSYGGEVSIKFALKYQNRLKTLILPNTLSWVPNQLRAIGQGWEEAAQLNDGARFFKLVIPWVYSRHFYQSSLEWLNQRQQLFKAMLTKEWFDSFVRLSQSSRSYYISPEQLQTIKVPTLLIGADEDTVTPLDVMAVIYENIKGSEFVIMYKSGHGAVLERLNEFVTVICGFVFKHSKAKAVESKTLSNPVGTGGK